jgi:hypothetical protein
MIGVFAGWANAQLYVALMVAGQVGATVPKRAGKDFNTVNFNYS